jgi:hypothetical protein
MDDTDEDIDGFENVSDDNDAQRLRQDNLFYLLSEIEMALDWAELPQEDVAARSKLWCQDTSIGSDFYRKRFLIRSIFCDRWRARIVQDVCCLSR